MQDLASFFLVEIYFKFMKKQALWLRWSCSTAYRLCAAPNTLGLLIIPHIRQCLQSYSGADENLRPDGFNSDPQSLRLRNIRRFCPNNGACAHLWASQC